MSPQPKEAEQNRNERRDKNLSAKEKRYAEQLKRELDQF